MGILALPAAAGGPATAAALGDEPAGWSRIAHSVVCDIAWRELSPSARAAVSALLATDPDYDRFGPSCSSADRVRAQGRFPAYRPAHYVNIPRDADGYDAERDCAERLCVVEAIEIMVARLRDVDLPTVERLIALKFLGHFVGDVHQPLHAGYGDDLGGNRVDASRPGNDDTNLHQIWDWFIVDRLMAGVEWDAYGQRLQSAINPVDRRRWASLDPADWANESFAIVESEVYAGTGDGCLTDTYAAAHAFTVERRLKQAGFRLGALLNDILGSA